MSNLDSFTITENFGGHFSDDPEQNLLAESGGDTLRIKIVSFETTDEAKRYASGQSILLESQYDSRLPPYPEFLTNQTGCEDRFLPELREHAQGIIYLVHAGERYNYGLCTDDLIRYKAGLGIFYCASQQKTFQVEYFIDKNRSFDEIESFFSSFTCK